MKKISLSVIVDLGISIALFIWLIMRAIDEGTFNRSILMFALLGKGILVALIGVITKTPMFHLISAPFYAATYFVEYGLERWLVMVFVACALLNFSAQRKENAKQVNQKRMKTYA